MNRKYYLRGIGVGILFSAIVLWVAYTVTGGGRMSDAEVIKRAEQLGMVQEENTGTIGRGSTEESSGDKGTEKNSASEVPGTEKVTENTVDPSSEESQSSDTASEDTEEGTTEGTEDLSTEDATNDTTEQSTEPVTEEPAVEPVEPTTEEPASATTDQDQTNGQTATFTVISGMNSWNVAVIMQEKGIIENAADFDAYLDANGYSSRISVGEFTMKSGTDYETLAKMLTSGNH